VVVGVVFRVFVRVHLMWVSTPSSSGPGLMRYAVSW